MSKLEFDVPDMCEEVVKTAVSMIVETMARGAAVNAEGSWCNKHPLEYHLNKGMHHILRVHHEQNLEALETLPPNMPHLLNGFTRLAMAWTLHKQAVARKNAAVLIEEIPE